MKDRGSTCKFGNVRIVFQKFHVDHVFHSILIFIIYQNCPILAMKHPF